MHMADVENPNPGGGGGNDLAVAAEPDSISKCWQPCEALFNCLVIVVSATVLLVLFSSRSGSIHASFPDIFWLLVGVLGLVFGAYRCAVTIDNACIRGNTQGIDRAQRWCCVCT